MFSIHEVIVRAAGAIARCSLIDRPVVRLQEIPPWMLDAAAGRSISTAKEATTFTVIAESAAITCRVSKKITSRPAATRAARSHCDSGPASRPIRHLGYGWTPALHARIPAGDMMDSLVALHPMGRLATTEEVADAITFPLERRQFHQRSQYSSMAAQRPNSVGANRRQHRALRQAKAAIAVRHNGVAYRSIRCDSTDIRHEHAWFAGHVRPDIPGIRDRE